MCILGVVMPIARRLKPLLAAVPLLAAGFAPAGIAAPGAGPTDPPMVAAPSADAAASEQQIWKGAVTLPGDQTLECIIYLSPKGDGSWVGSIDIPPQGIEGAPLRDIKVGEGTLAFTLAFPGVDESGWAKWELDRADGTATGTLYQSGMEFPTELVRTSEEAVAAEAAARRPQTPKPPFPYRSEDVRVDVDRGAHTLAGTLTLPEADAFEAPYPAVVLITGSGPQDRDETLLGHKPFAVIADHLTRLGVAVLRCDDRGYGDSTGDFSAATTLDFADDVRAQMAFLAARDDIDADRIGLVGHSEGGAVAPIVAADNDDVAFVVLLAGCAIPGDEVLLGQSAEILRRGGMPEARIRRGAEVRQRLLEAAAEGASPTELYDDVRTLVEIEAGAPMSDEALDSAAHMVARQLTSPWMVAFLKLDPREYLRRVRCPVLAINGELDVQVLPDENLGAIRSSLEEAGNDDVMIVRLDGVNHLLQEAERGTIDEYAIIQQTITPEALDLMGRWIVKRAGE